jgi:hypothetical protein
MPAALAGFSLNTNASAVQKRFQNWPISRVAK